MARLRHVAGTRLRHLVLGWLLCAVAPVAVSDVLTVPAQFSTIQAAIDAAQPGQTVVVEPGLYTENLTLRSGVDVRGEETALTLLRADDLADYTVRISDVDDVLFANFTLLDSDWGVRVENSTDIIIANNVFDTLDEVAVDTDALSGVDVMNNVFFDNVVAVWRDSANTWIFNNIFAFNIETLVSGAGDLHSEVSFNCFHANDDLAQNGTDTALGTDFQIGDPLFVDLERGDFHLRLNSPCIDAGTGTDAIDESVADIGAYGGPFADPWPFPVPQPDVEETSAASPPPFNVSVTWEANLDYRVTNPANPGSYRVYYRLNAPGPPYDGTDAGGGTQPSPIEVDDITGTPDTISFDLVDLAPAPPDPGAPQLQSVEPLNEAVALEWSAVAAATGYRIRYTTDNGDEVEVDVGEQTTFTLTGLENGVEHVFTVAALARATYFVAVTVLDNTPERHESVFSEEQSVQVGDLAESAPSNALAATPDEVLPEPDLPDDGRCFIATAAFSGGAPEVAALRAFRNRYLQTHWLGQKLVAAYYAVSPTIARQLERHPRLKPAARAALLPAVAVALFALESSPSGMAALLGLLTLLAFCVVRRRTFEIQADRRSSPRTTRS